MTITKSMIAKQLVKQVYVDRKLAEDAVEIVFKTIREAFLRGDKVELRSFGSFKVFDRKRRPGRNPRTGEAAEISESIRVRFKISKQIEEAYKSNKTIDLTNGLNMKE